MKKQKHSISLGVTDKERAAVVKRIKKTERLLRHFDLKAYAFYPGVTGYHILNRGTLYRTVSFDEPEWKFIEPLLIELVKWREYGKKFNTYMSKEERRKHETVCKGS